MKIYNFKRTQILPITLDEAWWFFSTPANLEKITPGFMDFQIVYDSGNGLPTHAGQIIKYRLKIFSGIPVNWTTEITDVEQPFYFSDEQRSGPYSLWRHQHFFKKVEAGVEMTDEVHYAIPFGFIGRFANRLFVERQLRTIFDYRLETLKKIFPGPKILI